MLIWGFLSWGNSQLVIAAAMPPCLLDDRPALMATMADSACCTDLECSGSHESSIDILKPREAGQRKFSALLRRHTCHTVHTLKPSSLLPTAICISSHHLTNHIRFQVGVTASVWTIFSASNSLSSALSEISPGQQQLPWSVLGCKAQSNS